jgi:hypothetical protein
MQLEHSKIRQIILAEHESLRGSLHCIEVLLDGVAKGDSHAQAAAHEQVGLLLEAFVRHIEHEERILKPVLVTIDAWGPERHKHMDEEHAMQRAQVTRLAAMNPAADAANWVREIRSFIKDLLVDMAAEEKASVSANVLRDDIIAVDADSE